MRPLRVVLVVHGRGRGHASRARGAARALRERGHAVRVLAGGAAAEVLGDDEGFEGIRCFAPGPRLGRRFISRVASDVTRLLADRPDVLVTDGDAPSMHAAAMLRIPVVAVGHGLVFAFCELDASLPRLDVAREALNALSSSWLADVRIAVHFGDARPRGRRDRLARISPSAALDRDRSPRDAIVAYFRDAGAEAWLEALVDRGQRVLLFGATESAPRGVEVAPIDTGSFAAALAEAKGVVGTVGSNLVAEAIHLGIPMLGLYGHADVEQRLNAQILEADGHGVARALEGVDEAACDDFVRRTAAVLRDGRRPSGLPDAASVTEALVEAVEACASKR